MSTDASLIRILNSKGSGTIGIFDKGDFYSVYREDAVLLASDVFRSDICLKTITLSDSDATSVAYLTMNNGQYQRVVREVLMILRYRIELYGIEDGVWVMKAKGTIGNVGDFEEIIGDTSASSTIMSVQIATGDNSLVSLCFWDTIEWRLTTTEFNDNALFSQVEQCIVGMNPRECVVFPSGSAERRKKLSAVLKRVGVMETAWKQTTVADWNDHVLGLLRQDSLPLADSLSDVIKNCLCGLYDYLKMSEQLGFLKKFHLTDYRTSGYMHIDASAVRALELFDLSFYQDSGTGGTLFSVLNKCKTSNGQRLLRDWLARPLCDLRQIVERQDVVSALVEHSECRGTLADALLPRVPDVAQLSRKLLQGKAKLQDCYRIYQLVILLRRFETAIRLIFESNEACAASIKELMLEPICYAVAQFDRFVQLIHGTVDVEHFERTGTFRVKPEIDPELLEISSEMEKIEKQCEQARSKICTSLDMDSVKLDCNAQHGFFYRVTLKDERNLRKNKSISILDTNKGSGVRFTDSRLSDLNERHKELNATYQTAQRELEEKVVETCAGYAVSLSQLSGSLAVVDVLVSLASVAAQSTHTYVRPKLEPMGTGILSLKQCRHPVLERSMDRQFIPNDVDLNGENRLIVLTGANMGGKSTYLRSIALTALMAQIGSFVPATSAHLSLLDGIFTRVGSNDQQTRGISTFMAEMLDSASILETATKNSLVIVDELGRGTSTFDGFGLAWAIACDLLNRVRCFCLFATHFHEMAELAKEDGVKAMQTVVCVENGTLSLLYEVRPGVAQSSFGIHVAQAVGFPENVVKNASSLLNSLEQSPDDLIPSLKAAKGEQLRELLLAL